MNGIVVSLNENFLKVSILDQNGFRAASRQLDAAIAANSQILNTDLFADNLRDVLRELGAQNVSKLPLHYLVEPQDIYLQFITIPKNDQDIEEQAVQQILSKLPDFNISTKYFSYQKIAPFVYQFIAIDQEKVSTILEVATKAGTSIASVVPWLALLPKFLSDNNPAIFISKSNGKQVVALSELNGIYFSGSYEQDKTTEDLQNLVQELSIYKRVDPIRRVFTVNYDNFQLDPSYSISPLALPEPEQPLEGDYKTHVLLNALLDKSPSLLETQLNVLNLLPLPVVAKKSNIMTYVGAAIVLLLIIGGIATYLFMSGKVNSGEVAGEANGDSGPVASVETPQSTPSSTSPSPAVTPPSSNTPVATEDISKEDLSIKVENGAGIAGVAASTQTKLENLGYKVLEIGNADNQGRDNTLVKFKTSKIAYRDLLISDIKDDFEIVFEEGLAEDSAYDVLIVVGKN